MTHFIIKLVGMSLSSGIRKAGDFLFSEHHKALIYQGREIPISEHNDLVPKVLEKYNGYRPRLPQVVLLESATVPTPRNEERKTKNEAPSEQSPPAAETAPLVSQEVSQSEVSAAVEEAEATGEASPAEPVAEVSPPTADSPLPTEQAPVRTEEEVNEVIDTAISLPEETPAPIVEPEAPAPAPAKKAPAKKASSAKKPKS